MAVPDDDLSAEVAIWTVKQAANWLGLSEATVRSRVADGTLPSVRLGQRKTMLPVVPLVRVFDPHYAPGQPIPRIMTTTDVAKAMKLNRANIYYLINAGSLPAVKIGNRRLFAESQVRRTLRPERT